MTDVNGQTPLMLSAYKVIGWVLLDPFILLLGPYKFSVNIISSILICELLVHAEDFIRGHDYLYFKCTIEGHCFLLVALMKSLKVYRVGIPSHMLINWLISFVPEKMTNLNVLISMISSLFWQQWNWVSLLLLTALRHQ